MLSEVDVFWVVSCFLLESACWFLEESSVLAWLSFFTSCLSVSFAGATGFSLSTWFLLASVWLSFKVSFCLAWSWSVVGSGSSIVGMTLSNSICVVYSWSYFNAGITIWTLLIILFMPGVTSILTVLVSFSVLLSTTVVGNSVSLSSKNRKLFHHEALSKVIWK